MPFSLKVQHFQLKLLIELLTYRQHATSDVRHEKVWFIFVFNCKNVDILQIQFVQH